MLIPKNDGIIKALEDLSDIRAAPPEQKVDASKDRVEKVLDLKMRGISNSAIAKALGVDPTTIWRDLKRARDSYRETLEQEPAANIIADTLMFLDKVEEVCLFEASQASAVETRVDPKTGEVIREGSPNAKNKFQFIRAALTAREMKVKLMLDTGVLQREPDKLYHTIKREDEETGGHIDVRDENEIKAQVIELLKRGKNI